MADIKKTLDYATYGSILEQEDVSKILQDLILRNNPIRANLPRKPGSGKDEIVVRRTAEGAASWVNDTEEIGDTNSTYERKSFEFKTVMTRGKITRKMQAVGKSLWDLEAAEIEAALEVIKKEEENKLIWGDKTTFPKQFDGLHIQIPSGQTVDLSANPLTLSAMDEAIDKCYGNPDMIICSKRTRKELNALLQQYQRFNDVVEVKGGFKLQSYNNIPIYWSPEITDTQGAGTESSLYIIDSSKVYISELTPLQMVKLPVSSSQYNQFDIFEDIALVVANEQYCAKIIGITPPV